MNLSADARKILQLLNVRGIGPAKVLQAVDRSMQLGLTLSEFLSNAILVRGVLSEKQLADFGEADNNFEQVLQQIENNEIEVTSIMDPDYPDKLRQRLGLKAPVLLFTKGNRALLSSPGVGFCGSRSASVKGLETAADCAEQFGEKTINVVSGYALGVDMATHCAALKSGGTTTIVLAEGINHFSMKREIKKIWDWERILVVSEFLPGIPWNVHQAMQRNQTIIGLSDAMILIEAREKGGSIEAGKAADRLGIPFWVADFQGSPETAEGNRLLLEKGAKPLRRSKSTNRAKLDAVFHILVNKSSLTTDTKTNSQHKLSEKPLNAPQSLFEIGYRKIDWSR